MPRLIQDEFTSQPLSRQRKYQLRRKARGQCRLCPTKTKPGHEMCAGCERAQRERMVVQRLKRNPIWASIG